MWFKNIKCFQLTEKLSLDDAQIEQALAPFLFKSCMATMPQSVGWAPVVEGESEQLIHSAMGYKMLCLKMEEKILPATVIQQKAQERIKEIETLDNRKLSTREKASIKDQIYFTLIQQAFCKASKIYAYFDTHKNWLVINCTHAKKLELFVTHFKKAFSEIQLITPEMKNIPKLMTQWIISQRYPDSFAIEKNATLEDFSDTKRVIRVKNQDLFHDSIQNLIKDNCVPKQISLTWQDRVTFNLNHDMTLTQLKYSDAIIEAAEQDQADNDMERFDADFLIMTQTLQSLMQEVFEQTRAS